jgi:hypothetical protein
MALPIAPTPTTMTSGEPMRRRAYTVVVRPRAPAVSYNGGMKTDEDDRILALEARLAAVAADNEALRARLDETRNVLDVTMRAQRRCRACGGRSIIHAEQVADSATWPPVPFAVAQKSVLLGTKKGEVEAYICAACGLMEWYVKKPDELQPDGKVISRLEPPPEDDPYR